MQLKNISKLCSNRTLWLFCICQLNGFKHHSLAITTLQSGLRSSFSPTHVVCVNFILEWLDLQFKVDSERQNFEKLFIIILFTLRVFARSLLRGNRRKNICILRSNLGFEQRLDFTSNKPIFYLLDYGDFQCNAIIYSKSTVMDGEILNVKLRI